jgi:hypothetical protein
MPEWLTGSLAIYAAALSTVLGILQIMRERARDKARIKVELKSGVIGPPNRDVIFATASNVGLRPVHLVSARFLTSDSETGFQPAVLEELPATLQPTQSADVWALTSELRTALREIAAAKHRRIRLVGAQFRDGSGTRYDGKRIERDLRRYLRDNQID